MTDYLALAILAPDGNLSVEWSPHDAHDIPESPTVGTLGQWLRDQAPYLDGRRAAAALVADMTADGRHQPDAYASMIATQSGVQLAPSDASTWQNALNPVSTLSADSAPSAPSSSSAGSPPSAPTTPSGASADSAASAASAESTGEVPRRSFLEDQAPEEPARQGWRGFLTSVGVRLPPGAAERAERLDIQAVSQHWPGPRTIAVVNGKGGAGKTPATILLAAVLARFGGAGVIAWDTNQNRGTLGWRTQQGPHDATVLDLLPEAARLLAPSAQAADLAHYTHHQTGDRYDVLRSQPLELAAAQRVSEADVDAIHAITAKYYRLTVMDSGNDESDPAWLRMIDHANQLVVPTTTRADHAEAGALLLEALTRRDPASAELARRAVVIISQADPGTKTDIIKRITDGFAPLVREVVAIPYDPALVGGHLTLTALRPATQRAWLAAAAAVARGL